MAKAKQARFMWIWGDLKKGIVIQRVGRRLARGGYWWYVFHVLGGRVVLVHGNFNKTEAIRQAKDYARYEEKHPRGGFCRKTRGSYLLK